MKSYQIQAHFWISWFCSGDVSVCQRQSHGSLKMYAKKCNEKCNCFRRNLMLMFYNFFIYIFTDHNVILLSTLKNQLRVSTHF